MLAQFSGNAALLEVVEERPKSVHKYVAVVRLKNSEPIIVSLNDAMEASGAHDASCVPPKKKDNDNVPAGYWLIKGKNTQVIVPEEQVSAIIVEPVVIDDSIE